MGVRRAAKNTQFLTLEPRLREPRHVVKSAKLLTREERIREAVKIIGAGRARIADIDAKLFHLEEKRDELARIRSRGSAATVPPLKTLLAALRRAKATLPDYFCLLLGLDRMIWNLEVYEATLGKTVVSSEKLKEWLEDLESKKPGMSAADKWKEWLETKPGERPNLIDVKPGKPKPNADEKRLAARAALDLLKTHGIKPTSTKTGTFCRLAAALYGDRRAGILEHQC